MRPRLTDTSDRILYQEQLLYIFTERRYQAMGPTRVAINVASTEEAERRIGAAIVDRWKQDALALAFDWASHRKARDFEAKE